MSEGSRAKRVAELVRQEIAALIANGLKDPRIGFVSIMTVRMSPDLRYASVYVSLYGDEAAKKGSLIGLQRSAGWIRREIGKHLRMRYTPEVRFFADDTLDQVYHLEEVFQSIHAEHKDAPMLALTQAEFLDELRAAKSVLLTTHTNPDGDAIGSLLGVRALVRALGKAKIFCIIEDPVPRMYKSLPGAAHIKDTTEGAPEFDLAVLIDANTLERAGAAIRGWIGPEKRLLVLDHHLGEGQSGAAGFTDSTYAATGEIVADLFALAEVPLTKDAAHALYVAQITDTGGYRFSNTSIRSHHIAARLLETGIDHAKICSEVFDVISEPKFRLLRLALERMAFAANGKLAYTELTWRDLEATGAKQEDLDNLVNYTRNIEGVEAGLLFYAVEPELTKVSMRCRDELNAAGFLSQYGGGGHAAAAGARFEWPLEDVRRDITGHLIALLETENADDAGEVS